MGKRHQVFVSSTYTDLKKERGVVIESLLRHKFIPAGMELFPATNGSSWEWIKRTIEESDYYVLIIGGRYGSIHKESGRSFTEMEYRHAVDTGKPTIAFLPSSSSSSRLSSCESAESKRKKLRAFIRFISSQRNYAPYSSIADLGIKVSQGIMQLQQDYPAVGWVKADTIETLISPKELLDAHRENSILRESLARTGDFPLGMAFETSRDSLVGTAWCFLGARRQQLNVFTFEGNGNVHCKSNYNNAKWRRLDENAILFSYGIESSYIVFKFEDENPNLMEGSHFRGARRYLKRLA